MAVLKIRSLMSHVRLRQQVGSDGLTSHEREQRAKRYRETVACGPTAVEIDAAKACNKGQSFITGCASLEYVKMKQKVNSRKVFAVFVVWSATLWFIDIIGWIIFGYSTAAIVVTIVLVLVTVYGILVSTIRNKPKSSQTCFIYCPGCEQELISRVGVDGTKLHDKTDQGEWHVMYLCGVCKTSSSWNFDIAPAPLIMGASTNRTWIWDEGNKLVEIEPWFPESWWTAE